MNKVSLRTPCQMAWSLKGYPISCVLKSFCLNTSQILASLQPLAVCPLQSHVTDLVPGEADGEPTPGQVHLHHGLWLGLREPAGQAAGPARPEGPGVRV